MDIHVVFGIFVLLLLAGCTAPPTMLETEESSKPISTRDSRGLGTSAEMAYTLLSTNNTTELHFTTGGMVRWAPDALQPKREALNTLPTVGTGYISFGGYRLVYRHVSTNNGTISGATGQFWFEVREKTPAAPTLLFGGGSCPLGMTMHIETMVGTRRTTHRIDFCPPSNLFSTPTVLEPGMYSLNLTARIGTPIPVKFGDVATFMPTTNALTSDQRPSLFFVYGSKAHDSVVHFDGWEEPKKKDKGNQSALA